jgi:hypothetical protein
MLTLVYLDVVLILTQDRCTVSVEHTIGSKIILDAPMELLGDVGHVESRSVCLVTVLVSVQDRCSVCTKRTIGSESFWTHPMVPLGDEALVDAHFSPFGDSANLHAR